jgi:hypothetical protein
LYFFPGIGHLNSKATVLIFSLVIPVPSPHMDPGLWSHIWRHTEDLYGSINKSRPTKRNQNAKPLLEQLEQYAKNCSIISQPSSMYVSCGKYTGTIFPSNVPKAFNSSLVPQSKKDCSLSEIGLSIP